jgi:hypothetical protein
VERLPNVDKLQEVTMSRTYRRRHDKAPDWVLNDHRYSCVYGCYIYEIVPYEGQELKREIAKWRGDAGWHGNYSETPSWWIHDFHEVPHRARTRNALKKINLDNYEEVDIDPKYKLPHIYYW